MRSGARRRCREGLRSLPIWVVAVLYLGCGGATKTTQSDSGGDVPIDTAEVSQDVPTDSGDNGAEDICIPDCQLPDGTPRICGPNGCGYICGICPFDAPKCTEDGQCVDECLPQCEGLACGPDGCGNVCGFCNPGEFCSDEGQCTTGCDPSCTNEDGTERQCGPDGCDSVCGVCDDGFLCGQSGQCVIDCIPQCEGKNCGPDECGGLCGLCLEDFICKDDGLCYQECVPDCTEKNCGSDGCAGTCGYCGFGEDCVEGQCESVTCGSIPAFGKCDGTILTQCDQGIVSSQDCAENGLLCLWDPDAGHYTCMEEPECVPDCEDKACGSDGCGGDCGFCPTGWACETNDCIPTEGATCGPFGGSAGHCVGDVLWFCVGGVLYSDDCGAQNTSCGFDPSQGKNECL